MLHAVARDWHPGVARFLIDNGADVNKADSFGRTPIFTAVLLNFPEMIEFLASRGGTLFIIPFLPCLLSTPLFDSVAKSIQLHFMISTGVCTDHPGVAVVDW